MAKVQSNKAKGRNLQKWVAERLSFVSKIPWGREDDKEIQSRPMGQQGVDIILRGEAAKRFPFSFECKSGESFQLVQTILQARDNQEPGRPWVIVHRRKKFRIPIVMMEWTTFEWLISHPIQGEYASILEKEEDTPLDPLTEAERQAKIEELKELLGPDIVTDIEKGLT